MPSLEELSYVKSSEPAHSATYQYLKHPPRLWPLNSVKAECKK